MWRVLAAGLVVASLSGCGSKTDAPLGRVVSFTPPPEPTLESLGHPRNADGTFTLIAANGFELRFNPQRRAPIGTVSRCDRWLAACYAPPERTMDDCYRSVPRCSSDEAWKTGEVCCPEACYVQYVERRRQGREPLKAWIDVGESLTCFPGVTPPPKTGTAP